MSHWGRYVCLFLMTHPNMTALGAMRASIPGLAAELGMDLKAFTEAFREALAKGFLEHDESASFVALPKFIEDNQPENPNVLKAWAGAIDLLPDCPLMSVLLQRVKAFAEGLPKAFQEALPEAFRKGLPNQEQEQEQEQEPEPEPKQEQERKQKQSAPSRSMRAPYTPEFEIFWNESSKRGSKFDSFELWRKLAAEEQAKAQDAMKAQAHAWIDDKVEENFIPHVSTWLHGRRWESPVARRQHSESEAQAKQGMLGSARPYKTYAERAAEDPNSQATRDYLRRRLVPETLEPGDLEPKQ